MAMAPQFPPRAAPTRDAQVPVLVLGLSGRSPRGPGLHLPDGVGHHLGGVAGDEVPGPGHASRSSAPGMAAAMVAATDGGHHHVPGARRSPRSGPAPRPGPPRRRRSRGRRARCSATKLRHIWRPDHDAPPVVRRSGRLASQPLPARRRAGARPGWRRRGRTGQGEQAGGGEGLAQPRQGQDVVEHVHAVGPAHRPHEHEARHELGVARRQQDGDAAAVAVAHHRGRAPRHGRRPGSARRSALAAMLTAVAAAVARSRGGPATSTPVVRRGARPPGPSRCRARAGRGRRGPESAPRRGQRRTARPQARLVDVAHRGDRRVRPSPAAGGPGVGPAGAAPGGSLGDRVDGRAAPR